MQFDTLANNLLREAKTCTFTPHPNTKSIKCYGRKLTTLKGAPEIVEGSFNCSSNMLPDLIGGPKKVMGAFVCSSNPLNSLKGAPEYVGGLIKCVGCSLTSLEGIPNYIGGDFDCYDNPNLDPLELAKWDVASRVQGNICFDDAFRPYPKEKCTKAYYDIMTQTGTKEQQELGEI